MSEGRNALLHLCFHRVKVQFMSYEILGMCKKILQYARCNICLCDGSGSKNKAIIIITLMTDLG